LDIVPIPNGVQVTYGGATSGSSTFGVVEYGGIRNLTTGDPAVAMNFLLMISNFN